MMFGFTELGLSNLENRFVALVGVLVEKGVFTIEEFEQAATEFDAIVKTPEYRDGLLRAAREREQKRKP